MTSSGFLQRVLPHLLGNIFGIAAWGEVVGLVVLEPFFLIYGNHPWTISLTGDAVGEVEGNRTGYKVFGITTYKFVWRVNSNTQFLSRFNYGLSFCCRWVLVQS